jgi:hypothetical protein
LRRGRKIIIPNLSSLSPNKPTAEGQNLAGEDGSWLRTS